MCDSLKSKIRTPRRQPELLQSYSEYCREFANERTQVLRAPRSPLRKVAGERFICIDGILIQECYRLPSTRLCLKKGQQLNRDNRVTIAKCGVTTQRGVMLAEPV